MSKKLLFYNDNANAENIVTILENYYADGQPFKYENIDITNMEYIEVSLSTSTSNGMENIISIGTLIDVWGAGPTIIHFYYSYWEKYLGIDICTTQSCGRYKTLYDIDGSVGLKIRLTKTGIYVNDSDIYDDGASVFMAEFTKCSTIEIGSTEGNVRSTAFYEYIKIGYI